MTAEELQAFCRKHGIEGPIETSALTGLGVKELVERMKAMIPWEDKPATVTTTTFKRIKDLRARPEGSGIGRASTLSRPRNSAVALRPPMPTGVSPTPRC